MSYRSCNLVSSWCLFLFLACAPVPAQQETNQTEKQVAPQIAPAREPNADVPGFFADRYTVRDPASWYPPRRIYTRKDYIDYIRERANWVRHGQDHGIYGAYHSIPALAVYAYDGDKELAAGLMKTMRFYCHSIQETVKERGQLMNFNGGYLAALIFSELEKRGDLTEEDKALRKKILLLHRQYTYQDTGAFFYPRGSHHRPQAIGLNHALAAHYFPEEPGATDWKIYADNVWDDWWKHRDVGVNDLNYFHTSLDRVLIRNYLLDEGDIFNAPRAREILWDRLLYETTPDGAVVSYGPHGGYNSFGGSRIFALEYAAAQTGDGAYKWAANRIMDFGRHRGFSGKQAHFLGVSITGIALASLVCDDSIEPVEPDSLARLMHRPEIIRLTRDEIREKYPVEKALGANMDMTDRLLASKLIFRAGWNPGDLYMLVECFTRHAPLNPTAIHGLERHAASFAESAYGKGIPYGNALRITDLSQDATFLGVKGAGGKPRVPDGWRGMTTTVPEFSDHEIASHATVQVDRYQGFEATLQREYFFIKNRFVLVRDDIEFDDTFEACIGPSWSSQHVQLIEGGNWANTWWEQHLCSSSVVLNVPPWDLLVWHLPHTDRELVSNPYSGESGTGDRQMTIYQWTGKVTPGRRLQFAQVLLPHAATRDAAPLAQDITPLLDEPGRAAVLIQSGTQCELAILNNADYGIEVDSQQLGTITTDARAVFVDFHDRVPRRVLLIRGRNLRVNDSILHETPTVQDREWVR